MTSTISVSFNDVWSGFFLDTRSPRPRWCRRLRRDFFCQCAHRNNAIALKSGARTKREVVDAGVFPAFRGLPQAIRAGDLLLLSGLLAIDENGLVESAHVDREQPYHGSTVEAQMDAMLESGGEDLRTAGTSLANVVRIQHYHGPRPLLLRLSGLGEEIRPGATCRSRR